MAPAFKKLLRYFLDQTGTAAAHEYDLYDVFDEEDEVVQQRLRIPGSPSHSQVQSGTGWVRASSDEERRSDPRTPASTAYTERTSAETDRSTSATARRSFSDIAVRSGVPPSATPHGGGSRAAHGPDGAHASQFYRTTAAAPPPRMHEADGARVYTSGVERRAGTAGTSCRRRPGTSMQGLH